MLSIIFIAICGFLAYLSSELEEWTRAGNNSSLYTKNFAWTAKWKYPFVSGKRKWYYLFLYKPAYEERFAYSSTLLVWITDTEHLFQFLKYRFIEAAFLLISWQLCLAWIIGATLSRIVKELFIKQID